MLFSQQMAFFCVRVLLANNRLLVDNYFNSQLIMINAINHFNPDLNVLLFHFAILNGLGFKTIKMFPTVVEKNTEKGTGLNSVAAH